MCRNTNKHLKDTVRAVVLQPDSDRRPCWTPPRRTVQRWLARWVEQGLLQARGEGRGRRYFAPGYASYAPVAEPA